MSELEERLLRQIKAAGLPEPLREYRFANPRMWRFDFAWPSYRLAVECEGGIWTGGRHTRGVGFERDCQKHNQATLSNWRVFHFTRRQIDDGEALRLLKQILPQQPQSSASV